jgi:hypothetical protein
MASLAWFSVNHLSGAYDRITCRIAPAKESRGAGGGRDSSPAPAVRLLDERGTRGKASIEQGITKPEHGSPKEGSVDRDSANCARSRVASDMNRTTLGDQPGLTSRAILSINITMYRSPCHSARWFLFENRFQKNKPPLAQGVTPRTAVEESAPAVRQNSWSIRISVGPRRSAGPIAPSSVMSTGAMTRGIKSCKPVFAAASSRKRQIPDVGIGVFRSSRHVLGKLA